jgi:hypothetical protein
VIIVSRPSDDAKKRSPPMALSLRRLRTHASISLANAIAIFVTIYSGWTLSEATLAYLGEFQQHPSA